MENELKRFFENLVPLEKEAWEDLKTAITLKTLDKGEHFLKDGDVCKRLGFIVEGYTRVYFLSNGEEVTKDFNFEDSFCGSYASFSLQKPSRFNVVAMEPIRFYSIGFSDFYRLLDKYPSLQKAGRMSIEKMFVRKELREASFLLDTPEKRYEELLALYPKILTRVPLKYIASYLGIRPETLSRIRNAPK